MTRRAAVFARIDALLELLGPGWYEELGTEYGNASLHLLARYGDPRALLRLGRARLGQFLIRYSHGQWHHDKAEHLLAVAHESIVLWDGAGMDFAQLGADLALEAEQALVFTAQIRGRMSGSPDCTGRPTRSRSPAPPRESGQSWRPRSPPGSVTSPVQQPPGDPLLLRPGPQGHPVRADRPERAPWRHHQSRRHAAAAVPVDGRGHGPPGRPTTDRDLRAADERRAPPRHRDLSRRDHPAHPDRRLPQGRAAGQPYVIRDFDGTAITEADGRRIVRGTPPGRPSRPRQETPAAATRNASSTGRAGCHRGR